MSKSKIFPILENEIEYSLQFHFDWDIKHSVVEYIVWIMTAIAN